MIPDNAKQTINRNIHHPAFYSALVQISGGNHAYAKLLERVVFWHGDDKAGQPRLKYYKMGRYWLNRRHGEWFAEIGVHQAQAYRALVFFKNLGIIHAHQGYSDLPQHRRADGEKGKSTFISLDWEALLKCASIVDFLEKIQEKALRASTGVAPSSVDSQHTDKIDTVKETDKCVHTPENHHRKNEEKNLGKCC